VPARLGSASLGTDDVSLSLFGGELACRIASSVYVALRGGASFYEMQTARRDDEMLGAWRGPAGGLALGAVKRLSKQSFIQTSFELMHTVVERGGDHESDGGKRRLDMFGLSVAYLFNAESTYRVQSAILQNFIDTLSFW
jgi:hypothetical protein